LTSQVTPIIGHGADPAPLSLDSAASAASSPPAARGENAAEAARYFGLTLTAWLQIAIVAVLMAATFRFNLRRLFLKTAPFIGEANWQHAFIVPVIGIYYLYLNREQLLKAKVKPLLAGRFTLERLVSSLAVVAVGLSFWFAGARFIPDRYIEYGTTMGKGLAALGALALLLDWGLATLLMGLAVFQYGIYPGRNDWTSDVGMVITVFGVVLVLCGWEVMRIAWFPILFLVCALPWPGIVYSQVASPLQELAARASVGIMNLVGLDASQAGTKIFISRGIGMTPRSLNVAEACAGLRSLMTFITVGAAVGFLSNRPLWQRLLLTVSAIPIAICCNVMRVAGQGIIDHNFGEKWSESFAHQFVGMVMLIPAFFMIMGVAWLLDQIFIEEVGEDEAAAAVAKVKARKQAAQQAGVIVVQRRPRAQAEGVEAR
jgi:exosortase